MHRSFITTVVLAFILGTTAFAHALQKKWVYVGGKDRTLSIFEVDGAGALTDVAAMALDGRVQDLVVYKNNQGNALWLYVVMVDGPVGSTVAAFSIDPQLGTLTFLEEHVVGDGAHAAILARPGGTSYLYVAHQGDAVMEAFQIDAATGGLTPLATPSYPADANVRCLATDATGRFLYATSDGDQASIRGWRIANGDGSLTEIAGSPWDVGAPGEGAWCFQPSTTLGRYWGWVAQSSVNRMALYAINPATGALTAVSTSIDAMDSPTYIGYDTSGMFTYVVNATGTISAFATDLGDGAIAHISTTSTDANSPPEEIAVSSGNVFVANVDSVIVFEIRVTGELVAVPGSPFPSGGAAGAIAIARTQF